MTANKILERLNQGVFSDGPVKYKRKDFVNEGLFNKNILKSGRLFTIHSNSIGLTTIAKVTECADARLVLEHRDIFNWKTTLSVNDIPEDCEFAWLNDFKEE